MADRELFDDRRRGLEEEYFRRKEKELIDKMRRQAEIEADRRRLAEQAGVGRQDILRDLQELGYTPDTVKLLHLVPLVQMAWAEGGVSDRERKLIVEAARSRGIDADSAADGQLAAWLVQRPSDELFEKSLRAIGAIMQTRPPEEREASEHDLVSYCTAIAAASGGILGFGAVTDEERQVLTRITQEMQKARG